jgi:hypothetical protein
MEEFRREVRGRTFPRNLDLFISDNMASYPTRQHFCEFLDILSLRVWSARFTGRGKTSVNNFCPLFHENVVFPVYKSCNWTFGIAY